MKSMPGPTLAVVLFVLIVAVPPVFADMVTVAVTGRVTDGSDFDSIDDGSLVTGYYRYDDATPNSYPGGAAGRYEGVTFSLTFQGGSTISSDQAYIWVNNNSSGHATGVDEYAVNFELYDPSHPDRNILTGAFAGLDVNFGARIHFSDPAGLAWDSVALPDPESVLALMPNEDSFLSLWTVPEVTWPDYHLRFDVTDLSVVTVPVPGALGLVVLGLGSSGWLLRRRNGSV